MLLLIYYIIYILIELGITRSQWNMLQLTPSLESEKKFSKATSTLLRIRMNSVANNTYTHIYTYIQYYNITHFRLSLLTFLLSPWSFMMLNALPSKQADTFSHICKSCLHMYTCTYAKYVWIMSVVIFFGYLNFATMLLHLLVPLFTLTYTENKLYLNWFFIHYFNSLRSVCIPLLVLSLELYYIVIVPIVDYELLV